MNQGEIRAAVVDALEGLNATTARLSALLEELDGGEGVQVPRQGRWTRNKLQTFWTSVEHLPGVQALFATTAARPNETVTFNDVLARSGLGELQQRSEHARMTRIAKELFNDKCWPIENFQGPPTAAHGAQMVYRMGARVASWWEEITGHVDSAGREGRAHRRKDKRDLV